MTNIPPSSYKTGALLVFLTWLNVLNFADRTLLGSLAKQIADDPALNVSYEAIGFLTGYGFIIFYTLIGVGMGTLADRWHRTRLIAAGLAIWSLLTAATGAARSFAQIALCRAFVGVGEATLTPSALSLLADRFSARLRAFASGTYYAGIPLGAGMGMIVSGYLLPNYGWRGCFIILGVLGLLFVLPVLFLRDPRHQAAKLGNIRTEGLQPQLSKPPVFKPFFATLRSSPALICVSIGASLAVYTQASSIFVLAWLQNDRGFEYAYVARMGGWLYLIGGTLGGILGGLLSDWFGRLIPSGGRLWFLVLVNLVFTPIGFLFFLGDVHAWYFKPLWVVVAFGSMVWYGAVYSTVAELAPRQSRATAIAFLIFCVNFLGAGPGPWVTGWLGESLPRLISEEGTARGVIGPLLDLMHIDPSQGFTFALVFSVMIGGLALPFNIFAALRYRTDLAKARVHENQ